MNPIGKNYVTVDLQKLRKDTLAYCQSHGLVMSRQLILNGISDSLFSNAKNTYLRNMQYIDSEYCIDGIDTVGRIQQIYYDAVLKLFELKDVYKIPLRSAVSANKKTVVVMNDKDADIVEQLKDIEMAINRLGNVMMQILEKMPKQTTIEKPIAKLPEKK